MKRGSLAPRYAGTEAEVCAPDKGWGCSLGSPTSLPRRGAAYPRVRMRVLGDLSYIRH